jgi:16S rRNA (guanine527-N7)-methyltransferase
LIFIMLFNWNMLLKMDKPLILNYTYYLFYHFPQPRIQLASLPSQPGAAGWVSLELMTPGIPKELERPLRVYLALLERWNRIHALTSLPRESRREELLLDACALLPHLSGLEPGQVVVDLGTGMGIPSVVIALARPDLQIVGVDGSKKKIAFLRQACLELGLENLRPLAGRFETLPSLAADCGVAKALAPLPQLLDWWRRHGRPGGPFLALKGPEWRAEALPPGWTAVAHPYELPTRGARWVVEARQAGAGQSTAPEARGG